MRLLIFFLVLINSANGQKVGEPLPPWAPGTLDIHQIQTGRGNAVFLVFPDATTMLIDAGSVPDRPGPELGPERPSASRTPAEWIARYIQQFSPRTPATLDYAVITHYHDDHMAAVPALGGLIPIAKLIDRGDTPVPLPSPLTEQYRKIRQSFGGKVESLRPGHDDQIVDGQGDGTPAGFPARLEPVARRGTALGK